MTLAHQLFRIVGAINYSIILSSYYPIIRNKFDVVNPYRATIFPKTRVLHDAAGSIYISNVIHSLSTTNTYPLSEIYPILVLELT
jgi:hypothetical protein